MNYIPLNNYILIKEIEQKEKVSNKGIILTESDDITEKYGIGTIIKHGLPVQLANGNYTKFNTKIGEKVLFRRFGAHLVEIDGVDYYQIYESDILGIYEEIKIDDDDDDEQKKYVSDIANGK